MKPLIIIGAGGQARETAQWVEDVNQTLQEPWALLGFADDHAANEHMNILGNVDEVCANVDENVYFICAIGNSAVRQNLVERMESIRPACKFATIIHPSAVVAGSAKIGSGCLVAPHTVISTDVRLDRHVLINYGSTIGHDSLIHDYASIMPGTSVSGQVTVEALAELGAGSVILPGLTVHEGAVIGAGAVVTTPIPAHSIAVGVPAKVIKTRQENGRKADA
ncbi:hypothetical protein SY83_02690 [Paenibacillus swuensis]|uniref:PglD N-terminal domain-containing protein n=1 Tax=Paenibacillus swuensis TaxID=1178515 RepID=A0A172TEH2_9BACL|nr:acetyltransferase [Paenibacillus swuensis]ANE45410.1 hypothetical protein SY83_02690 [Paenibacillus swuensis]